MDATATIRRRFKTMKTTTLLHNIVNIFVLINIIASCCDAVPSTLPQKNGRTTSAVATSSITKKDLPARPTTATINKNSILTNNTGVVESASNTTKKEEDATTNKEHNSKRRWLESSYAHSYHPRGMGGFSDDSAVETPSVATNTNRQNYFTGGATAGGNDQDLYGNDMEAYLKPGIGDYPSDMDGSSDEVSLKMYALPGTASEGEVGDNARNRQQLQQPQPKTKEAPPSISDSTTSLFDDSSMFTGDSDSSASTKNAMSVDEATPAKVIDNALTNIEKEASLLMKETTSNPKDISEEVGASGSGAGELGEEQPMNTTTNKKDASNDNSNNSTNVTKVEGEDTNKDLKEATQNSPDEDDSVVNSSSSNKDVMLGSGSGNDVVEASLDEGKDTTTKIKSGNSLKNSTHAKHEKGSRRQHEGGLPISLGVVGADADSAVNDHLISNKLLSSIKDVLTGADQDEQRETETLNRLEATALATGKAQNIANGGAQTLLSDAGASYQLSQKSAKHFTSQQNEGIQEQQQHIGSKETMHFHDTDEDLLNEGLIESEGNSPVKQQQNFNTADKTIEEAEDRAVQQELTKTQQHQYLLKKLRQNRKESATNIGKGKGASDMDKSVTQQQIKEVGKNKQNNKQKNNKGMKNKGALEKVKSANSDKQQQQHQQDQKQTNNIKQQHLAQEESPTTTAAATTTSSATTTPTDEESNVDGGAGGDMLEENLMKMDKKKLVHILAKFLRDRKTKSGQKSDDEGSDSEKNSQTSSADQLHPSKDGLGGSDGAGSVGGGLPVSLHPLLLGAATMDLGTNGGVSTTFLGKSTTDTQHDDSENNNANKDENDSTGTVTDAGSSRKTQPQSPLAIISTATNKKEKNSEDVFGVGKTTELTAIKNDKDITDSSTTLHDQKNSKKFASDGSAPVSSKIVVAVKDPYDDIGSMDPADGDKAQQSTRNDVKKDAETPTKVTNEEDKEEKAKQSSSGDEKKVVSAHEQDGEHNKVKMSPKASSGENKKKEEKAEKDDDETTKKLKTEEEKEKGETKEEFSNVSGKPASSENNADAETENATAAIVSLLKNNNADNNKESDKGSESKTGEGEGDGTSNHHKNNKGEAESATEDLVDKIMEKEKTFTSKLTDALHHQLSGGDDVEDKTDAKPLESEDKNGQGKTTEVGNDEEKHENRELGNDGDSSKDTPSSTTDTMAVGNLGKPDDLLDGAGADDKDENIKKLLHHIKEKLAEKSMLKNNKNKNDKSGGEKSKDIYAEIGTPGKRDRNGKVTVAIKSFVGKHHKHRF